MNIKITYKEDIPFIPKIDFKGKTNEKINITDDDISNCLSLDSFINRVLSLCPKGNVLENIEKLVVERKGFLEPIKKHIIATTEGSDHDFLPFTTKKMKLL